MDLYIIHFIFITLCAGGSYLWGFMAGEKSGSQRTVELFLDDNLVTLDQIEKNYNNHK
jgi:hypothetical protein